MKKGLFTLLALFMCISVYGETVTINGINFELNSNGTAKTTGFDEWWNSSVVIPSRFTYGGVQYTVTSIGDYAFFENDNITSVYIPNTITSIGYNAFSGCYSLNSATIPNSVTYIGDGAFNGCSLTSLIIPNSMTSIGNWVFCGCPLKH